ncbi:hypothetical protein VTO42DRAFT_2652 [Malbranchea cinnamomea]
MAPSTVFSYLRRDHRRANSPARHTQPPKIDSPPQLPATPQTPTLTDALMGSGVWKDPVGETRFGTEYPSKSEPQANSAQLSVQENGALKSQLSNESHAKRSDPPQIKAHSPAFPPPERPASPWRLSIGKSILTDGGKLGTKYGKEKGKSADNTASGALSWNHDNSKGQLSSSKRHSTQEGIIPHSQSGKTKLNLLNPLNLLARRRSGQYSSSKLEKASLGLPALPDDYDPRIRGKVIHDFSSPRPRSYAPGCNHYQPQTLNHEANGLGSLSTDTGFVGGNALERQRNAQLARQSRDQPVGPKPGIEEESRDATGQTATSSPPALESDREALTAGTSTKGQQEQAANRPLSTEGATPTASNALSRSSTTRDGPRRLLSSASRFSFDIAGMSSAQEKLLEEKHKQKEAARKAQVQETHFCDSDSENLDYDAMMDDGELEEKIPGVNAEADEDDNESDFLDHGHPLNNMGKQFVPVLPPLLSNPVSPLNFNSGEPSAEIWSQDADHSEGNLVPPGLNMAASPNASGLQNSTEDSVPGTGQAALNEANAPKMTKFVIDDDFYYDDGMFDDILETVPGEPEPFDESIFDDPNSHLYNRRVCIPNGNANPLPTVPENERPESARRYSIDSDEDKFPIKQKKGHALEGQALNESNIEAFSNALADVANQAALKEGLERTSSGGSEASVEHGGSNQTGSVSQAALTPDDAGALQKTETMAFDDVFDDFDYNDMNGLDEDDAIIAAANQEALENDVEGIYGQEFGFYAHAHGQCDSERVYGGYFGPRGVEGIHRSHSGRANFQEPSLTPITERSEWSTRNSIVSLAAHQANYSHSNPSLSSPALAQLMDMGNVEDEMSFSALRKLRRGAFGGSNGSLRSAPSPTTTSSPQGPQLGSPSMTNPPNFHDFPGDQLRPMSWMPNSSSGPVVDNNTLNLHSSSDNEASPAGLWTNKGDNLDTGKAGIPSPLSIDTARGNVGTPAARRSVSYAN